MTKRLWQRMLPLATFLAVFCGHALYLRHLNSAAEGWADVAVGEGATFGFAAYLNGQDYYLGFSYALSAGFVAWSLINYLSRRRVAMAAGAAGGVTVVGVLMTAGCFLTGCCGSPMLGIYATLFGIKAVGLAKPLIAGRRLYQSADGTGTSRATGPDLVLTAAAAANPQPRKKNYKWMKETAEPGSSWRPQRDSPPSASS